MCRGLLMVLWIHFWKNNHFTKLLWIILISTLIFLLTLTQIEFKAPNISMKFDTPKNNITHYFINTPGCKIPSWPIFSKDLEKYFKYDFTGSSCNNGTPPLVQSNITSLFLMEDHFPNYNIDDNSLLHCCYEELKRKIPSNGKDRRYEFGDICIPFNGRADILMEFVHVKCKYVNEHIYEDFFAFVPPKHNETFINNTQKKYNVLIMGLDSISRLNFHRQMPKTVKFLKELGFVEFLGYNKLADNTHPNLITVLTGYDEKTIRRICKTSSNYFDNCKFIWDNFKAENYITSFGEDAARLGIFNFEKKGFKKQPTDYMWGFFNLVAEKLLGNSFSKNVHQCVGGREVYKIFLQYVYDFVSRMESWKLPYFAFFWSASLSHDEVNNPRIGDVVYLQSLRNMSNKGYFDNTIVVLMSDHGIRFGSFRQTYQGGIEDRLPFMFIKVPRQFEESFPLATSNLKWNAKVLTTHFDVYETLLDISSPSRLTDEFIESGRRKSNGRTGLSLFQKIQPTRTCKAAGIPDHWCTCLNSRPISISPEVTNVVQFVIEYINKMLRNYSECEKLLLHKIISAHLLTYSMKYDSEGETNKEFLVNFQTQPGDGLFEATVRCNNGRSLEIVDSISRLDLYGNQSICIDNYHLKKYCYCKKCKSKK